jgi:glycosyltransferase involved in cell wall biosynthesis
MISAERPARVLHVLPSLDEAYGGPLRLVLDLSARAERYGLESEVIGIGEPRLHDNPLHPSNVHSVPHGFGEGSYGYSPRLRGWLKANLDRFDGVIVHGAWAYPGWAVARECRQAGVPYVYFPHGMLEQWAVDGQGPVISARKRLYWRFIERRICQGARRIFYTTARERDLSALTLRLSPETTVLPPYGIDPAFPPVTAPDNPALRMPPERNLALFLGRLHQKKNAGLLIEAWHRADVPANWNLVIAGSGSAAYVKELRQRVDRLKLTERILFPGFVHGADKNYLLQRAAWFLLPSSQENFGVAVLEAVQRGCAVAISERVYLAESFRPDSEILPLTIEAWTEFVRTRMQDSGWRLKVRDLDRAHLMNTFRIDLVVENWARTMKDVFHGVEKKAICR